MALNRTFIALTPDRLKAFIMGARRRVIYAGPSLSLPVATALINAHDRLAAGAVAVVVDASEGVLRLGYGVADALGLLRDRQVPIRHAEGLRISFVVVDEDGYVFALAPLLVEDNSRVDDHPNAVRASRSQVEQLVDAVMPPCASESPPLLSQATPTLQQAEIGQTIVPSSQIARVEEAIRTNPVENFDLRRVVNVFSTYLQFYELEVIGTHVERRTIQLPKELLGSIRDKTMRDRISAAFKMISNENRISGAAIQKQSAEIRKRFIRHHPTYGGVILKANRGALDAGITKLRGVVEIHSKVVLERFDKDVRKSIASLVQAFWRDIVRNPPLELLDQGISKPSTEQAKDYLRRKLIEAFPKAQVLAGGMRVTTVVKDITWNTLNDQGFVDWLRTQWPQRTDLKKPFEEYRAARERASPSRSALR